ncbi:hypothetical protein AXF42_Ash002762 [Apostasia shenzhenica]|uniref:Uncharacterized protein n=1 Tax=Apostasia shenzhenica TaxID=1088818 RepID=A0A2I0A779_9ASPA|nr:hypothetical protein AXF42_Ash002762 [Apostasia shenzhenica]
MASGTSLEKLIHWSSDFDDIELNIDWEDVTCPICLDFPHNGVLLQCMSYDNGCRPFMCDTDHTHSNCLTRFKSAFGVPQTGECLTVNDASNRFTEVIASGCESRPACPLCRGEVTGWVIIKEARAYLNTKKRCCQEKNCSYIGNFVELQTHAQLNHPHSRPSEIDPVRRLDWENFQQSSDIIDVLSTIQAEVPHGVVLGDYVIEYGDEDENGNEYDNFQNRGSKWWNSCILYQVFGKFRCSRSRRSRRSDRRQSRFWSSSNGSNEGSSSPADTTADRFHQIEEEFRGIVGAGHRVEGSRVLGLHSRRFSGIFHVLFSIFDFFVAKSVIYHKALPFSALL